VRGRVAKRYPDVNFLIYHSGFVPEEREGPYDARRTDGIDGVITSLRDTVTRQRTEYRDHPDPSFRTYGPRTRR
jgi:hypothetical protein